MQGFVWTYGFNSLEKTPRSEVTGSQGKHYLVESDSFYVQLECLDLLPVL